MYLSIYKRVASAPGVLTSLLLLVLLSYPAGRSGAEDQAAEQGEASTAGARLNARRQLNADLLSAIAEGESTAIDGLIESGASPNARNESRRTALMLAATMGHEVTELVIQEGFDVRVEIQGLPAPPVTAVQLEMIELLLRRGADIEAADEGDKTALMLAVERDYSKIAELLLAEGADPDARYASGLPLLSLAANRGFVWSAKVLLEAGADAKATSNTGLQALHYSAEMNHVPVAALLLDKGVPVDVRSEGGWTALHTAASRGHAEMVTLLLERGADSNLLTPQDMSAERVASARGHAEIVELLGSR